MLDTIFGALIGVALASEGGITVKTVDLHEKAQIDKVLEIANTINFLGRTFPADTDITDSVIELKAQFGQIDGDAIKDPVGRANYDAVKAFFDTHLSWHLISFCSEESLNSTITQMVDQLKNDYGYWGFWGNREMTRLLSGYFYQNNVDNYFLWQVSSSGLRHNSSCTYFRNSNGHGTDDPDAGKRDCKRCGGSLR